MKQTNQQDNTYCRPSCRFVCMSTNRQMMSGSIEKVKDDPTEEEEW